MAGVTRTSERTLAQRDLNRAMLARQMLLEPVSTTIPRVLERMGGLQAQYAPSMYIGLWTRKVGFERDQLDRALRRRVVVQGTLMRSTITWSPGRTTGPWRSGYAGDAASPGSNTGRDGTTARRRCRPTRASSTLGSATGR